MSAPDPDHIAVTPTWPLGGHEADPPVVVRTFARSDERLPVVAFLHSEGVPTYQPDGNALSIDPGLYVAVGFHKVAVPTSMRAKAFHLLTAWDHARPLIDEDAGHLPAEPIPEGLHGPSTGMLALLAVLFATLIGVLFLFAAG